MITDSGLSPVLMDLGSLQPSPQAITDRSQALAAQDTAAEHSTMPYRAPELFDVSPGMVLDGKVDVWSLGCTLFACLVGKSPFEMRSDETGGSLSICVLGGDWRFPDEVAGAGGGKGKGAAGGAPKRTGTGLGASGGVGDGQGQGQAAGGAASGAVVISEPIKHVIRQCLKVETAERPDINELIVLVERALEQLPDDDQ